MKTLETSPLVSIVLPCRNEQGYIQDCLESALQQQPPEGGFEIIVADGMSTDGTREYLESMAASHPNIRLLDNPGRIVSTGLNAAIKQAHGQFIVRMDAHTIYAPDYVRQCLAVMQETGADNVGGPMQTTATTLMEHSIREAFHSSLTVGGARSHQVDFEGYVDTVIYGCWRRNVFDRVGGFDEDLVRNQDDEHNLRLTRAGGRIYQSTRIQSRYHVRGSLHALFRQYMQYGYWKVLVIRKHRTPASIRHLVPGLFVGSLVILGALGLFWSPALLGALILAWSYATVATLIACVIAAHSRLRYLPLLPIIVACFHFGYGYGFLRGILDFVVLKNAPDTDFVRLTREPSSKITPVRP